MDFSGMSDEELEKIANGEGSPEPAASGPAGVATPTAPQIPTDFSSMSDEELAKIAGTPGTDPEAPSFAKGDFADSPIMGESAVDVSDRFKLAFGNKDGNVNYLKEKFGANNVVTNKDDELVVKGKDNLWRAVDPNTGDAPDSWSLTKKIQNRLKETASEVAENIPTAARIGSSFVKVGSAAAGAATAPVTFGTSLIPAAVGFAAGAAVDGTLSSFGRMFGTYKGDVVDQLKDATFEGALNTLGVAFDAGVKPTMKYLGNNKYFSKLSSGLKSLADENPGLMADTLKWASGGRITTESVETVAKYGDDVDFLVKSKGDVDHEVFKTDMWKQMSEKGQEAGLRMKQGLSRVSDKLYGAVADDIAEGSFAATNKDLIDPILSQYASMGAVKIEGMSLAESTAALAEQGGKLTKDQKWQILTPKELRTNANITEGVHEAMKKAAVDMEAYKPIRSVIDQMIKRRDFAAPAGSKERVLDVLKTRQSLGKLTNESRMATSKMSEVSSFFADMDSRIEKVTDVLIPEKAKARYDLAKAAYKKVNTVADELLSIKGMETGKADSLVNAMFSKSVSGSRKRSAFQDGASVLLDYGDEKGAAELAELHRQMLMRKAAVEFTAPMAKVMGPLQAAGLGGIAAAASQGDVNTSGVVAGTALMAASPRNAYRAIKTQLAANAMARATVGAAKDAATKAIYTNKVLPQVTSSGLRFLEKTQETKDSLMSQIPTREQGQP